MLLTVTERLVLLNLLPVEGTLTTLKLLRKLREDLSFSEEDHKKYNFRQQGEQLFFDSSNDTKEILIGEILTAKIKELLSKLNTDEKLRNEHLSVYEKFFTE